MFLLFLVLIVAGVWLSGKGPKTGVKRCWDAPIGEKKVHHWVIRSEPDSPAMILICKVCGQKPGEE